MPDLRSILSPEALAALAAGYDDATFRAANQGAVQGMYPALAVLTDPVLDAYYPAAGGPAPLLSAKAREMAMVTALAASGGSSGNVAIHLYVALAVGATVDELAGTLGVVGAYAGVSRLMDGLTVFETTLQVLAAQVAKGEAGLMAVVPALKSTFPLSGPLPTTPTIAPVVAKAGAKGDAAAETNAPKARKADKPEKSGKADKAAKKGKKERRGGAEVPAPA